MVSKRNRTTVEGGAARPGRSRLLQRLTIGTAGAIAAAWILLPGTASAATPTAVEVLGQQVNLLWVVIGAVLVIFMQAGFALVETGFTRAKHAAHVVSTNFAVFGLGFVAYFVVGYGLMFGGFTAPTLGMTHAAGGPLIGHGSWVFLYQGGFALTDMRGPGGAAALGFFLYMVAFMDTTATIPTGSMAERWRWRSFVGWGLFCGAIFYPLFGAWTWGGGWLSQLGNSMHLGLGYVDFAGSGVVHAVGGAAALAGALVLGPRIGKYNKDGSANTIGGHHIPMAMLGTFILLFGWFGFNAASTFAATDVQFATVAANTAIAAAFGACAALAYCMFTGSRKPDPGMMANGMLGGLVAITAPCAFVDPWAAAVIGSIAGVLVIFAINFFDRVHIDDPVGAISVHGVCGTFGLLSVGIFANGSYGAGWNATSGTTAATHGVTGILGGNVAVGLGQLMAQAAGAIVIWTVMFGIAFAFFKIQDALTDGGIRSSVEDELVGVDIGEMGVLAYPEFSPFNNNEGGYLSQPHAPSNLGLEDPLREVPRREEEIVV